MLPKSPPHLDFAALRLQRLHRLVIAHAWKWGLDGFKLGGVALEHLQFFLAILEHPRHQRNHQLFRNALHLFEIRVGHFRLYHPEFGQMTAGLRFFSAKCWAEAIDLAECHGIRFVVKLAGLRQIYFFIFEIIHFEKRRGPFASRRREDWRIHQHEAVRIEIIPNTLDHFVPHSYGRMLPPAAQPQVAMIHQKVDAVLFGRDRIGTFFGDPLDHLRIRNVQSRSRRGPRFGAHRSRNR